MCIEYLVLWDDFTMGWVRNVDIDKAVVTRYQREQKKKRNDVKSPLFELNLGAEKCEMYAMNNIYILVYKSIVSVY